MADLENTNGSARSTDTGSKLVTLGQVKNAYDNNKRAISALKGDLDEISYKNCTSDNRFDNSNFESGYYNPDPVISSDYKRSINYYDLPKGKNRKIYTYPNGISVVLYDDNKAYKAIVNNNTVIPDDASLFRCYMLNSVDQAYISTIEPTEPINYEYKLETKVVSDSSKLNKNLGAENKNKVLLVSETGDITTGSIDTSNKLTGTKRTRKVYFGDMGGIKTDGSVDTTVLSEFYHLFLPVIQGDTISISGYGSQYNAPFYVLFDSSDRIHSYFPKTGGGTYSDYELTIPEGVTKIGINTRSTPQIIAEYTKEIEIDNPIVAKDLENAYKFTSDCFYDKSMLESNGAYSNNAYHPNSHGYICSYDYTEVKPGEKVFAYFEHTSSGSITIFYYDENKTPIGEHAIYYIEGFEFTIPENAKYIKAQTNLSSPNFSLSYKKIDGYKPYKEEVLYTGRLKGEIETRLKYVNPLYGKKIVNFGDSIFNGGIGEDSDISYYISQICGAEVVNVGVGGTLMSIRTGTFDAAVAYSKFDAPNFVKAVCNQNFDEQDAALSNPEMTTGVAAALKNIKAIDFSKVDIVTFAYGTNDYTARVTIEDTADGYDTSTFEGSMKYITKMFQTTYPHIKILFITPIYRYLVGGQVEAHKWKYGDHNLLDFVNSVENTAKNLRIPYLNAFENLSISEFNRNYFMMDDGTHLIPAGRKLYAELIEGKIRSLF